ncbi:peptidoglycan/LPS O-acetylase OafA/YrhL [Chryseobacterium sediminis]|uniref:Peptidoglycan/LPS O-acetylase OafA/YrhL n=1 Tax=Chryseobacterium sediminis TaxID=1679494 RepID=A0ABR6Q4W4_9FLAO|nr:acyltransferase [Chryseobacterium sediminis]MBB6332970.1 peptidoglycan/LPS O-acetylase OafA/YrhL [Chryseobacterium sediminis]
MNQTLSVSQSKPHYEILDGLRGVAAIMVVFFHVFETFSNGDHTKQIINHGYLAVDFFFMLSGYVISYAYDNRWNNMTLKDFFIRRLVRLQPMIIIGSLVGAVLFYFQHSEGLGWGGISATPVWKLLLVMFIGMTVIPVGKSLDIRGWNEMHPLNGPSWSLFFEYIANIVYALVLRRVSKIVLGILVLISAGFTIYYAFTNPNGDIIGGWSIDDATQMKIGFTRLAFPFLMGIFLARAVSLKFTKNAFFTTSILLIVLFAFPRLGGTTAHWQNAFYECFVLMIMFPVVILLGAGGKVTNEKTNRFCKFLGDISYPIYITHFPLVYVYMAWVVNGKHTLEEPQSWILGFITVSISIILAYCFMKFYDVPVRKWLNQKLISKK